MRRSKEDEEDAECENFSSQFDNLDREEGAQPSESPSELPTTPSGMQGQSCDSDHAEGCDNNDGGTDVTEDERSPDEVSEEALCLEARFCRLVELELVPDPTKLELESDNPSEKVEDNRERYAKLALMLFCPFTDLEELKILMAATGRSLTVLEDSTSKTRSNIHASNHWTIGGINAAHGR